MIATIRHDWTLAEILALLELPLHELLFRAHTIHRQHFDPRDAVMILNSMCLWDHACRAFGAEMAKTLIFVNTAEFLPGNPCRILGLPARLGPALLAV